MSLRYHHVYEEQQRGLLRIAHCGTKIIPSDLLSKELYGEPHNQHARVLLGHEPLQWHELNGDSASGTASTE